MTGTHGILLIDKPPKMTSHDVVDEVRRILRLRAVGHCGTLDPMATGLLAILIGNATKLSDFLLNRNKRYRVEITLGVETDTGDATGTIEKTSPVALAREEIVAVLESLQGEIALPVPRFSAIKVKGRKLCDEARRGHEVEVPTRVMHFFDLKIDSVEGPKILAEVSCEKGGYIRSWAVALGERLGCGAHISSLRRLKSDPYSVDQALTLMGLDEIAKAGGPFFPSSFFVPLAEMLPDWSTYSIGGRDEELLRNGQIAHDLKNRMILEQKAANDRQGPVGIKVLSRHGNLIGLLEAWPAKGLKIKRIFSETTT